MVQLYRCLPEDSRKAQELIPIVLEHVDPGAWLVSLDKIKNTVATLCNPPHVLLTAIDGNELVGVLGAIQSPHPIFERNIYTVVMLQAWHTGAGIKMIREVLRIARKDNFVKAVTFSPDTLEDPRAGRLLERLGVVGKSTVYTAIV